MIAGSKAQPVLFFDGVCNLCNNSIQFVIRHDHGQRFRFATLQSAPGAAAIAATGGSAQDDPESLILLYNDRYYTASSAALKTASLLSGPWKLLYAFIIVPPFIRNAIYRWIARNRYRWFGRQETCMIPTPELQARFIT